jgi:hypothetical protein
MSAYGCAGTGTSSMGTDERGSNLDGQLAASKDASKAARGASGGIDHGAGKETNGEYWAVG